MVRLRQSTACSTMYGQKDALQPLATRLARTFSRMDRIARSATPLSWCTCAGQRVCVMEDSSSSSPNCFERNSPALSECRVPSTLIGVVRRRLSRALNLATNFRMHAGASLLFRRK